MTSQNSKPQTFIFFVILTYKKTNRLHMFPPFLLCLIFSLFEQTTNENIAKAVRSITKLATNTNNIMPDRINSAWFGISFFLTPKLQDFMQKIHELHTRYKTRYLFGYYCFSSSITLMMSTQILLVYT